MESSYESHRGVPLQRHLRAVGEKCRRFVMRAGTYDRRTTRASELMGKSHDFGKYTPFFMQKLYGKPVDPPELSRHPPLSAVFTAWLVERETEDPFLTAAAFMVVRSHHTRLTTNSVNLPQIFNELVDEFMDPDSSYRKQLDAVRLDSECISNEMTEIGVYGVKAFLGEFSKGDQAFADVRQALARFITLNVSREEKWRRFFTTLLLFSSLIDADTMTAANVKAPPIQANPLAEKAVETYRTNKFGQPRTPIAQERESVYRSVMDSVSKIIREEKLPRIMTLTAPTGSGKTIAAYKAAFHIRNAIRKREGKRLRIIYALPFINIIEQNHSVLEDILRIMLSLTDQEKIPLHLLLKHHHLYFPEENENLSVDEALMLSESWNSEIVVTTFVQLFHTLFGTNHGMLKKFHNMAHSIIILDEVQAIPIEYWRLVREGLKRFAQWYNCYIISMTATQPMIFYGARELVQDSAQHFKRVNRLSFSYEKDPQCVETVAKQFVDAFKTQTALLVMNTIASSILAYNTIKERLGSKAVGLRSKSKDEALFKTEDESRKPQEQTRRARLRDVLERAWKRIMLHVHCGSKETAPNMVPETEKHKEDGAPPEMAGKIVLAYLSTNIIPKERLRRVQLIDKLQKLGRKVLGVSTQVIEAGVDLDFGAITRDLGSLDAINQAGGRCDRNWTQPAMANVRVVKLTNGKTPYAHRIYGRLLTEITERLLRPNFEEKDIAAMSRRYFRMARDVMDAERSDETMKAMTAIELLDFQALATFKLIEDEPKTSVFIELDADASKALEHFKHVKNELKILQEKHVDIKEVINCKNRLREARTALEQYTINTWSPLKQVTTTITEESSIKHIPPNLVPIYYDEETGFITPKT